MDKLSRPAWVEINREAIAHNVAEFRRLLPKSCQLMSVVKANGYGHGDVETARIALANGANWLAVALPEEGLKLRRAGIVSPILVLGALMGEQLEACVTKDLTPTVFQWEVASSLSNLARRLGKTVRVHVKVDTGMGRMGLFPEQAGEFIRRVSGLSNLEVQGVYTHFASADQPGGEYVYWQWSRFRKVLSQLKQDGIHVPLKHCANTAATMFLPECHLDMVRVGLGTYGLYPNSDRPIRLKEAFSLKAKVAAVKRVPPGSGISYGSTHVTWKETSIAVLPLGYADGVNRLLSNQGKVIISGKLFPIVGRVCMDSMMIDVGDSLVEPGDEGVLIGGDSGNCITVDDWANKIGTINYEVPCMISHRVPRIYV